MAARFRIDQVTPGQGVLDRSRHDLIAGEILTLVVPSPVAGATYTWEIVDKVGSTAVLSASTGTTVTIGLAATIVAFCGFVIKLTETVGSTVTTRKRIASVRSAVSSLRPIMFAETANRFDTLALNDASQSTDNALYADRAGLGSSAQNFRGYAEALYEMAVAIDAIIVSAVGLATGAPVNVTKSAAVIGVSTLAARQDHKHDVTTDAAAAVVAGASASEGASASLARADHGHSVATAAPVAVAAANAEGASGSFARADHVHAHGTGHTGDTDHGLATASNHGFMSSTYAAKLDSITNEVIFVTVAGTSKTLALSDGTTTQLCTAGTAIAITVPTNTSVPFPIGTVISFIAESTGQVTLTPFDGTVTIESSGNEFKTSRQEAEIFLKKKDTNSWHVTGEKAA